MSQKQKDLLFEVFWAQLTEEQKAIPFARAIAKFMLGKCLDDQKEELLKRYYVVSHAE